MTGMANDSSGTPLPAPDPPIDSETEEFWAATRGSTLLVPRCNSCGEHYWYPRRHCPLCGSDDVALVAASGRGTIHSFTPQRRLTGPYRDVDVLVLAYVELEEGPLAMTNIVDADPSEVHIGDPVEVVFSQTESGYGLYRFRITGGAEAD